MLMVFSLKLKITNQDIVDVSTAVSDVRSLWKEIHISGKSNDLLAFLDFNLIFQKS